jgi:hypothetical protein
LIRARAAIEKVAELLLSMSSGSPEKQAFMRRQTEVKTHHPPRPQVTHRPAQITAAPHTPSPFFMPNRLVAVDLPAQRAMKKIARYFPRLPCS